MVKGSAWLCLPRKQFATKGYAVTKIFLLLFFLTIFVAQVAWSVIMIRHYRQKVADTKAASFWPSRSELQVYTTHSHFFLFTGLISSAIVAIGFWGVLMEYLVVLAAFSWMVGVNFVFELIGAWQSGDEMVQTYKGYSMVPAPLLFIMGLVFAHMIRECERKLAESPLYKKKQAEMKSRGETGTAYNVKKRSSSIESDDTGTADPANNNTMTSQQPRAAGRRGIDNVGLDIDDEVNRTPLDAGVLDRPSTVTQKDSEAINIDVREGS